MSNSGHALLLGKPLHGQLRPAPDRPERLVVTIDKQEQKGSMTGYGGMSMGRTIETKVTYVRIHLNTGPADALVYARQGYEPQPEDVELVLLTFGEVGNTS